MQAKKNFDFVYVFLSMAFIIGLLPKMVQMLIIIVFLLLLILKSKKIYINKNSIPFLLLSFIHFISIMVYMFNNDSLRILAAFNTALLWFIGGLIFSFLTNIDFDKEELYKISYVNILIIIVVGIAMLIFQNVFHKNLTFFGRSLYGVDWLNNVKNYRLLGFMEYSNLIIIYFFLFHPFAVKYVERKYNIFGQVLFLTLSAIPVILTNSRVGVILLIFYYYFIFTTSLNIQKKKKFIITLLGILITILFCVMIGNKIIVKIDNIIHSRENSTSMRSMIYKTSIEVALEQSPIIGLGVKEYIGNYPLGSHSTFIGFFYKTGVIGFFLGVCGFLNFFLKILKKKDLLCILSYICLIITLCVEDLDGANWIIITFFCIMGMYIGNNGGEVNENISNSSNL